ncbi:uncharacterized protein BO97DRAFT_215242 [Aspergillus homomorphus CBS 101889]|uniref:Secreted protein n=1 Tax=Aspergillus homomorphus (strain CBS 101889) TaxID=1450537 RepID=A0A395I6P5_ASPHC|nr:hypothetical protein BO97DRAFT_215242 [Aspergillus homomorphus CBS 101889]RAL15535.1 hypothetical protein BO97DRAFT_215242 [Aspergillus homomorphus CBS 101889]
MIHLVSHSGLLACLLACLLLASFVGSLIVPDWGEESPDCFLYLEGLDRSGTDGFSCLAARIRICWPVQPAKDRTQTRTPNVAAKQPIISRRASHPNH